MRIDHARQIIPRLVAASVKGPASHRVTDRLERLVARRRAERDADPAFAPSRQPRPESVAEDIELMLGVVSAPILILAVDDFRLLRIFSG